MAYYLKKTKLKGRTYLSIDESFYSQEKKGTAHKCYKSLGSVETLIKNGMADPVSFYQQEVDRLNSRKKQDGVPMISERSPSFSPVTSLSKVSSKGWMSANMYPFSA